LEKSSGEARVFAESPASQSSDSRFERGNGEGEMRRNETRREEAIFISIRG